MPRLILNADDFGLTPGINRAIVELHRAGCLTSASLMATGPAFRDAVRLAREHPRLGIGCHLVFVDGIPISHPWDIPTLLGADDKTFRPQALDFAQAALRHTIRPDDLAREAQAQIQTLQRAGLDVTHIDTHKHTHLFPSVARPVLHAAERCGVLPVRAPFEPRWSSALAAASPLRRLQQRVTERFAPTFAALTADRRTRNLVPAGTLGIAATGTLETPIISATLEAPAAQPAASVRELCRQPDHADAALDAENTVLRASREGEYAALLDVLPHFLSIHPEVELIHYGSLGIPGLQRLSGQFTPYDGYEA